MKIIILSIIVVILALVFIINAPEKNLYLVAQGSVPIYESLDSATSNPAQPAVGFIKPKQSAEVIKCINLKSYQVYKVRLFDDRKAFVNEGDYLLLRNGDKSSC